jgi:hypothetical protein
VYPEGKVIYLNQKIETRYSQARALYLSSLRLNMGYLFAAECCAPGTVYVNFMANMKALKTIMVFLLGIYICWTPLLAYLLYFSSEANYDEVTVYTLMLVVVCNSLINPLVYTMREANIFDKCVY